MVVEYAVETESLDICVVVDKSTDKYPFYCDSYPIYILVIELVGENEHY